MYTGYPKNLSIHILEKLAKISLSAEKPMYREITVNSRPVMGSFSTQYVSDEFKSRLPRGNKLAHISARSWDRNCSKNMKYRHTGLPKNLNIKKKQLEINVRTTSIFR